MSLYQSYYSSFTENTDIYLYNDRTKDHDRKAITAPFIGEPRGISFFPKCGSRPVSLIPVILGDSAGER